MSLSELIYIIVRTKARRTFWFGPISPAPAGFIPAALARPRCQPGAPLNTSSPNHTGNGGEIATPKEAMASRS